MKITKFFALLCAAAVAFVGCSKTTEPTPDVPETSGKLVLKADKTAVSLGETVTFTVEQEGVDVTSVSTIYDADMNIVNGTFTPIESGSFSFFATKGAESSNQVVITVLASMPPLPEDPEPANTKFNHRIIIIDHTGVNCGYCPGMVDKLRSFAKTEWHSHYNEVTCHAGSMAGGDPGNSAAANALNAFQSNMIEGYPNLVLNFYAASIGNYGESTWMRYMDEAFKQLVKKDGADAGIALSVTGDQTNVYCAAQIKSAKTQEYKVAAWLLESQIYSPNQSGATKDYHKIYDFALRNIAPSYDRNNVQGESVGVIEAGQTLDCAYELPIISTKWAYENMDVLVIVSAKDSNGRWELVNSALCHIGESKAYEYVK